MATWFISGASRGIGLGICQALLAQGETVIGACRNPEGARDLWELASDFKGRFRSVKMDVSDPSHIEQVGKEFANATIDVLINNAGILRGDADGLATLNFDDVMKSFEVNTIGPMRLSKALLPALRASKNPKIGNMSSMMGSISDNRGGGHYAYRMSKTALNMFNSCFAIEFPEIISVVLHPGWVETQMGGSSAPVKVHDSVEGLLKVMQGVTKRSSGTFINYKGDVIPW